MGIWPENWGRHGISPVWLTVDGKGHITASELYSRLAPFHRPSGAGLFPPNGWAVPLEVPVGVELPAWRANCDYKRPGSEPFYCSTHRRREGRRAWIRRRCRTPDGARFIGVQTCRRWTPDPQARLVLAARPRNGFRPADRYKVSSSSGRRREQMLSVVRAGRGRGGRRP